MKYKKLGDTDIDVSILCLGTMTYGEQTGEQDAHQQLDYALDHGVNFIDTAEMYAVPARKETYGKTEEIIGNWIAQNPSKRDQYLLATKVLGPAPRFKHVRPHLHDGKTRLDRQSILEAVEGSLKRLKTDYIDLYQLHWPDRNTNIFDRLGYEHVKGEQATPIEESLNALGELVQAGKVRYIGVSNETPWGIMEFMRLAKDKGLPMIQSIQNPYNLLKRDYEIGLAEMSCRTGVGLLAYSPLAMGVLTGKYRNGNIPEHSRMKLFGDYFSRYMSKRAQMETEKYCSLAEEHGLDPAIMALAFVNDRPFVTSNIIGATTLDQLKAIMPAGDVTLSHDTMVAISKIHQAHPIGY